MTKYNDIPSGWISRSVVATTTVEIEEMWGRHRPSRWWPGSPEWIGSGDSRQPYWHKPDPSLVDDGVSAAYVGVTAAFYSRYGIEAQLYEDPNDSVNYHLLCQLTCQALKIWGFRHAGQATASSDRNNLGLTRIENWNDGGSYSNYCKNSEESHSTYAMIDVGVIAWDPPIKIPEGSEVIHQWDGSSPGPAYADLYHDDEFNSVKQLVQDVGGGVSGTTMSNIVISNLDIIAGLVSNIGVDYGQPDVNNGRPGTDQLSFLGHYQLSPLPGYYDHVIPKNKIDPITGEIDEEYRKLPLYRVTRDWPVFGTVEEQRIRVADRHYGLVDINADLVFVPWAISKSSDWQSCDRDRVRRVWNSSTGEYDIVGTSGLFVRDSDWGLSVVNGLVEQMSHGFRVQNNDWEVSPRTPEQGE